MDTKCPKCGGVFSRNVTRDGEGLSLICRNCGDAVKVNGLVIMAFADDSDPSKDRERFVEGIEESTVRTWYTFDSAKLFMDAWRKMVEKPDGMWYWVFYNGECICSGACDPYDEDIFDEEFGLDETGEPVVEPHWKEMKWSNWKECSYCGSAVQQAEDYERSGLYQFCPRCGKRVTKQEPAWWRGGAHE
jgi:predicted RNA-binding Zn-ribbon protein involved in translation (DUF1610 family)